MIKGKDELLRSSLLFEAPEAELPPDYQILVVVFAVGLGGVLRRTLRIIHKDKRGTNEESKTLVTSASGENSGCSEIRRHRRSQKLVS
jgi:hypothetical protein